MNRFAGFSFSVLALFGVLSVSPACQSESGAALWDSSHPSLDGWQDPSGLDAGVKDGNLVLNVVGPDSRFTRVGLSWQPSAEDTFLIRYRATGFAAERTSGEIFYVNGVHGVDGGHYVIVPSLTLDGEWHDMRLPVSTSLRGDMADWAGGGPVTLCRFDIVNEAPGTIEIATILLTRGMRAVSAEDVAVDSPRHYFIPTDSFTPKSPGRFEREFVLPDGVYSVWGHIFDTPAAQAEANAFSIAGAAPQAVAVENGNAYAWRRVGRISGGRTTFVLSSAPSALFDAVLIAEGDAAPVDKPIEADEPVVSTIVPLKDTPKADLKGETRQPDAERAGPGLRSGKAALESEVRDIDGVPRLFVNGAPFYPMVGNGTGCGKQGTLEAFTRAGYNIDAMWVDGDDSPQWWTGPGTYDFARIDRILTDDLNYNPDVLLLPILWAAPPRWWQELHPEERALFSDGQPWEYYRSTPSFASELWRRDAAEALTAFVNHVEASAYASRVVGYWVVGGVSAEWQGWGAHTSAEKKRLMDYSTPAKQGFRAFLQAKYPGSAGGFADAEIPSYEERLKRETGVFRCPAQARRSIDFNEFYSESLADTLLSCTRAAKNAAGRKKIVGVYFGYSLEYTNMSWCLQSAGHNALRKVLDSPDVDFLSAPPSYGVRGLGKTIGWMWPWRSIQTAGKLVWVDDDTRTFLSGECDYTPAVNLEQTLNMLRRNFATALCRLCPQGFLQLNSGRELDHPDIARDMRVFRRAGEFAIEKRVGRKAEIAVVVDEDSVKYLAYDDASLPSGEVDRIISWNGDTHMSPRRVNTLMGDLVGFQRDRIARIGAPVDWILWSDLPKRELAYKCYIMLDCFQYDDAELKAVREKVYGAGGVVLWCYAPGFIHDGKASAENMEILTGMKLEMLQGAVSPRTCIVDFTTPFADSSVPSSFGVEYAFAPQFRVVDSAATPLGVYRANGAVSLAVKNVQQGKSIFCGSNKLTAQLMRCIAEAAGVHIYEDDFDPFDANDSFLTVHASTTGEKTFHLPRKADVFDVFEGKRLFSDVDSFKLLIKKESTKLLHIGDADAAGFAG